MKLLMMLITALLIAASGPFPSWAAEPARNGTFSFVLENDLFSGKDRHYTNGMRLIWLPDKAVPTPKWVMKLAGLVPWFPEQGEVNHGYALGQSMFTPSDITLTDPPSEERPYAGWLYATIGLAVESGRQLDQLGITLGMVGPASFAEQSQTFIHRFIDSDEPEGWDTQLENEPGIVLTCQRSWRGLVTTAFSGNQLDFTPHIGAALGNVFTYGSGGLTVRYGRILPQDYGPPRIQPGLPGSGDFSPKNDFGWYLFAGIVGRAVARNIFLDGNTFRESRSVDKKPFVGDLQFGIVLDWSDIRLSYTHVLRSREFRTQDSHDDFGSFSLSIKF